MLVLLIIILLIVLYYKLLKRIEDLEELVDVMLEDLFEIEIKRRDIEVEE